MLPAARSARELDTVWLPGPPDRAVRAERLDAPDPDRGAEGREPLARRGQVRVPRGAVAAGQRHVGQREPRPRLLERAGISAKPRRASSSRASAASSAPSAAEIRPRLRSAHALQYR
jgi:hypothetical protein